MVTAGCVDGIDHVQNPHPRCPIAILADTSGSMAGTPIMDLGRGLTQFYAELAADDLAALRAEPMTIGFGGTVQEIVPFGPAVALAKDQPMNLTASGDTPLGRAVVHAITAIDARCRAYAQANLAKSYSPWVVILSDGEPTDLGWEQAAHKLRQRAERDKWNVLCVAIGENADIANLQKFSRLPVKRLEGLKFAEFFVWLSRSFQRVSHSSTATTKLSLPPTSEWEANT